MSNTGRGTMDRDGRQFPISTLVGDVLPDAYVHQDGLLPQLHGNLGEVFPNAQTCREHGDLDPPGDYGLEEYGTKLGQLPEKQKDAAVLASQPRL